MLQTLKKLKFMVGFFYKLDLRKAGSCIFEPFAYKRSLSGHLVKLP